MTKIKNLKNFDVPAPIEEMELLPTRDFAILEASIKDGFCNYQYEVINGIGTGDRHGVKGAGIVKESLEKAMANLTVHMAVKDDVFKNANLDLEFNHLQLHEFTQLYYVTGFKIKNDAVIISGNKYLSGGDRMSIEVPKIFFDESSSYNFYYELGEAVKAVREEVALYREGNYVPVEDEKEFDGLDQIKMDFSKKDEDEFENAAVK